GARRTRRAPRRGLSRARSRSRAQLAYVLGRPSTAEQADDRHGERRHRRLYDRAAHVGGRGRGEGAHEPGRTMGAGRSGGAGWVAGSSSLGRTEGTPSSVTTNHPRSFSKLLTVFSLRQRYVRARSSSNASSSTRSAARVASRMAWKSDTAPQLRAEARV